tara:strand:+ start:387 stop:1283 length:897 start_codon:yes stop_codon:yes gene_type:complete
LEKIVVPIKVMVLGSTGMLGHQVVRHLAKNKKKFDVINVSYRNKLNDETIVIDVEKDFVKLEELIDRSKPKIIINCIGVLISGSLKNQKRAKYINAHFPHLVKKICKKNKSKMIHISTDCVFSGKKGSYIENDSPNSMTIYGQSKSLGEIIDKDNLTLRTSIIGPEIKKGGEGLLSWFLNEQNSTVKGYSKAIWSGVTTIELAKVIEKCLTNNIFGLYHVTNNEKISKYDLLTLFNKHLISEKNIISGNSVINDKSLVDTRNELNYVIPSYRKMIEEMFKSMVDVKEYHHYKNKIKKY